jgi:hypothetical protein
LIEESINELPWWPMPRFPKAGVFIATADDVVVSAGASMNIRQSVTKKLDRMRQSVKDSAVVYFIPSTTFVEWKSQIKKLEWRARRHIGDRFRPTPQRWWRLAFSFCPMIPGVYVLFSGRSPIYVGQAEDIQSRLENHAFSSSSRTRGKFDRLKILEVPDKRGRNLIEACLIYALKPALSRYIGGSDRHAKIVTEGDCRGWNGQI